MKSNLIYRITGSVITEWGHEIYLEIKLWQYPDKQLRDFPEGYKFNWIAFNLVNPDREFVLFDNHHAKPPHIILIIKKNDFSLLGLPVQQPRNSSSKKSSNDLVTFP